MKKSINMKIFYKYLKYNLFQYTPKNFLNESSLKKKRFVNYEYENIFWNKKIN